VKITADDEAVRDEASELFATLDINRFLKDMILQLLVKGECVGFKRLWHRRQGVQGAA
jgi:hypothetical protein